MLNLQSNSSIDSISHSSVINSTQASTHEIGQEEDARFVPILPESFWKVLDLARLRVDFSVRRKGNEGESPMLEGNGSSFVGKDWSNWREDLEEEEESLRLAHLAV